METLKREHRPDVVLELAPHCALQPVIAQCLQDGSSPPISIPTFMRERNSRHCFLESLGALFRAGVALDFASQYPRPQPIAHPCPASDSLPYREFRHAHIHLHMQPSLASMKRISPLGVMGYPWGKLVAEQGLLFAQAAGMPIALFRLPQTGVSSTGFTQASDVSVSPARTFSSALRVPIDRRAGRHCRRSTPPPRRSALPALRERTPRTVRCRRR